MLLYVRWKRKVLNHFGDPKLISTLTKTFSRRKTKIKNTMAIFILVFIIIGLSNPQFGKKFEEVKREGVDLIVAVDLSSSMIAEDITGNRLDGAKRAINKLIENLEGDRIGIVIFAGEAFVQLPITTDYSVARLFVNMLSTDLMTTQGTEISEAINLSVESFDMDNNHEKAIIIFSDGENHDQQAIESAKDANDKGVLIHTVGLGSKKGASIPTKDGDKRDNNGNKIISKLNEKNLIEIATSGEGSYIHIDKKTSSNEAITLLLNEINEMEKKEVSSMVITEYEDRFQFFIGLALLLLFIELLITTNKKKTYNTKI